MKYTFFIFLIFSNFANAFGTTGEHSPHCPELRSKAVLICPQLKTTKCSLKNEQNNQEVLDLIDKLSAISKQMSPIESKVLAQQELKNSDLILLLPGASLTPCGVVWIQYIDALLKLKLPNEIKNKFSLQLEELIDRPYSHAILFSLALIKIKEALNLNLLQSNNNAVAISDLKKLQDDFRNEDLKNIQKYLKDQKNRSFFDKIIASSKELYTTITGDEIVSASEKDLKILLNFKQASYESVQISIKNLSKWKAKHKVHSLNN